MGVEGLNQGPELVKKDVAFTKRIMAFYNVTDAGDTSGLDMMEKCLYNLPQMNHQPQEVGGLLTGAKGAGIWTSTEPRCLRTTPL